MFGQTMPTRPHVAPGHVMNKLCDVQTSRRADEQTSRRADEQTSHQNKDSHYRPWILTTIEVTSALPTSQISIEYLMEERLMRGSGVM
ncbi:hypothetical protein EVAR_3122_1 [Eumeta japonica]|uniref:Uncharacterized protein n=1 Tax=Eumeta variegata TaxID=151549 RepID=A0A4C1XH41_EUMVA|nr:hypothetical protein EVAR_3122_1 [Eumeta japonica]